MKTQTGTNAATTVNILQLVVVSSPTNSLLLLLFMSTRWDAVSELRPRIGLLFIPQVTYEYGEPRRSDIDRGKPKPSREKPVPMPLYPPHVSHGLTWAGKRSLYWECCAGMQIVKMWHRLHWQRISYMLYPKCPWILEWVIYKAWLTVLSNKFVM
jgi:hypothetical protein